MKILDLTKERLSGLLPMWLLIMLVAIWSVVIQDGHINRDGLLYLKQAYLIAEGSWKEGLALYPWPFFSVLIAVFHKLTNLHLQVVAHGVDLALFSIAALFYLKTLQLIYHKEKQIVFYGGIILLSFIPIMDDYMGMVLRDHGLWAGCMMGTYFYFKYLSKKNYHNNLLWQLSFVFAGLFRPEAFVFLILIPVFNLIINRSFDCNFINIQKLFKEYSVLLIYIIFSLANKLLSNTNEFSYEQQSRLSEFIQRLIGFFEQISAPLPLLTNHPYLNDLLVNYPITITFGLFLTILIVKWIKGLGLLVSGLLIYYFTKAYLYKLVREIKLTLYFFIVISFLLVGLNLFNVYVLSNRYWVFHWFWVFILVSPVLISLFNLKTSKINKVLKISISFFVLISFINVLVDSDKNTIEIDAGGYFKNMGLENNQSIKLINSDRVGYYGGMSIPDLMSAKNPELQNTQLIIFNGREDEVTKILGSGYQLEKSFTKNHQGVYILKRISND
jgi:hypothetical protein